MCDDKIVRLAVRHSCSVVSIVTLKKISSGIVHLFIYLYVNVSS